MKRAALALALVAVAALAGSCSSKKSQKLTIAVSIPSADHGWTGGVGWWAEKAMAQYPDVKWVYDRADKPETQVDQIHAMVAQNKLDALVLLAHESKSLTPVGKEVASKGIYLVSVDRGLEEPVAKVFIEGDNKAFGRKSAEFMVSKLGAAGGKIVILRGSPSTVDTDRYEAAVAVFKQHPEIEILGAQAGHWKREKGLEVMKTFLTQFPKIDAVWAQDDDMAEGAEQAIREGGREKEMWMLGGAGKKTIIKRVMDKDAMYPADITYPPAMIAAGIHTAVFKLGGSTFEQLRQRMPKHISIPLDQVNSDARHIKLDVDLVTPENAKDYYFPDSVY